MFNNDKLFVGTPEQLKVSKGGGVVSSPARTYSLRFSENDFNKHAKAYETDVFWDQNVFLPPELFVLSLCLVITRKPPNPPPPRRDYIPVMLLDPDDLSVRYQIIQTWANMTLKTPVAMTLNLHVSNYSEKGGYLAVGGGYNNQLYGFNFELHVTGILTGAGK